ncbi:MAG: hypothetical protein ACXVZ4_15175 [Gaiellaceae bacterium]
MWGEPRRGLLFAAGPLLARLGLVGLLPLVALAIASPLRRAATGAAGVLAAVAVAGIGGGTLPFAHEAAPARLALGETDSPHAAASVVLSTLQAHPVTLVEAAIVALAAAALPFAVRRGYLAIGAYGVAVVVASLVAGAGIAAVPAVCAAALTCLAVATARYLRESDVPVSQLVGSVRERLTGGLVPAPGRASAE